MTALKSEDLDKMHEAVVYMEKCLGCPICLNLISAPVKTRCGHSFCHTCITSVLRNKNALCPLCKASLKRRTTTTDKHLEISISKFEQLVSAIYTDTGIPILSHRILPYHTKEGYPTPSTSHVRRVNLFPVLRNIDKKTQIIDGTSHQPVHTKFSNNEAGTNNPSDLDESNDSGKAMASSSFITLAEGKEVSIRSLNHDQMKTIIGLQNTGIDERQTFSAKCDSLNAGTHSKDTLPVKSQTAACRETPRSSISPIEPPVYGEKSRLPISPSVRGSAAKQTGAIINYIYKELKVSTPPQKETPQQGGRLLLKQNSDQRVYNAWDNKGSKLQINSVKRDLTKQMCDDQLSETSSMLALEIGVNRTKMNAEKEASNHNTSTISSRTATPRIKGIKFKKLGKLVKVYIPKCHFIYYGFTKCKRTLKTLVEKAESKAVGTLRANLSDNGRQRAKPGLVSLETKSVSSCNPVTDKKTWEAAKDLSARSPAFLQISPFTSKDNFEAESKEDTREPPLPTIRNTCDDSLRVTLDTDGSKERFQDAALTKTTSNPFNKDWLPQNAEYCLKSPSVEIRILNPERDSQLKYLSRQSPSNVRGNAQKFSNLGTADKRKKLIDGGSGSSLRPMKKRRRLLSQRNLQKVAKFGAADSSDDSDLDYHNIVNATPIAQSSVKSQQNKLHTLKSSSKRVLTKKPRLNTSETALLNHSSTDVTNKISRYNGTTNTTKDKMNADTKRYKEFISLSHSDTDATHFSDSMVSADGFERSRKKHVTLIQSCLPTDENTNTIQITRSASSKKRSRERSHSNNGDLNVANKTLNGWCNDINRSQNSSKRAKSNDTSFFVQLISDTVSNKKPLSDKVSPKKRSDTTNSQTTPVNLKTSPMQGIGFFGNNTSCRHPGASFPVTSKNDIKRNIPKDNLNEGIIDRVQRIQKNPTSSTQENTRTITSSPDLCANAMDIVKQVNMPDNIINDVYSADFDMEFFEASDCLNKEVPNPRIPSAVQVNRVTFKKQLSNKENTGVAESTNRCNQSTPENLLIPCPSTKLPSHDKELRFDRALRDNLFGLSTYSGKEDDITKRRDTEKVKKCAGRSKDDVIQNITNTMNSYAREQDTRTAQRCEKEKGNHQLRQNMSSKKSSTTSTASFMKNDNYDVAANDEFPFNLLSNHTLLEGGEYEQKDSYDLDSIFIITQQQMLLSEFEQNLFTNRITCTPEEPSRTRFSEEGSEGKRSVEEQLRTPRTSNRNLRVDNGDPHCPGEQEDVIENTPDTKVKNNASYNNVASLAAKRNLTEPQASTISRAIHTIYHSTPKRPQEQLDCTKESSQRLNSSAIRRFQQERMCLVGSGLSANQIGKVQKFASLLGATYTNMFSSDVTHVVVSTKENNATDKTLKYLQGIVHKKWVVGFKWVQDCMNNMKLLNEEPYEAVDSTTLEPGPRNSRLRIKGFFEGFTFLCIEPFSHITSAQYRELLTLTGGVVVETMQALILEGTKFKFIVFQADLHQGKISEWYRKNLVVPITDDWVVDCISQYKMLSLCTYLQEIQVEDVRALGYPEELLIEEELDSDN